MPKRAKQLFQEFVVVVVGVFVAVAAESWWSEREDRRFEREIREDMLVELESNIRILDADIAANEEARVLIAALSGLSDESLFAIPDAVLSEQFGSGNLVSAGFDPELGSVQALVESGNLGAVGDRELRLRLSRWEGLLQQCRRKNVQGVNLEKSVMPLIVRAGSDLRWSEVERRELRALLDNALGFFDIRVACQHELRSAAHDILAFLKESNWGHKAELVIWPTWVPGVRLKAYHWSVGQGSIATYCTAASQTAALEQIADTEAQPTLALSVRSSLDQYSWVLLWVDLGDSRVWSDIFCFPPESRTNITAEFRDRIFEKHRQLPVSF